MSNISKGLKTATPSEEIETVSILDIQKEIEFEDVRLVHHQATGNQYLHLVCPDDQYLSIKVGSKAEVSGTTDEEVMYSLIANNIIYTGENERGVWFTFGRKATMTPTKTVSFKTLMKKKGVVNAATNPVGA
jgi:hypothetical protein